MKAAWDAAGEVIKAWATEGHSVPLPGLGTMRFSVRSKAVEELEDVKTSLITTRRIVFTPSVDVKEELADTNIQITCLDEDGTVLKRVTSDDGGEVEDPDSLTPDPSPKGEGGDNGNGNQGGGDSDE
jgi:predicted histone-like DNA-binding protein